jgi:Fic family protein
MLRNHQNLNMSLLKNLTEALPAELESRDVMRQFSQSNRYLAELKGAVGTIPNESLLIETVGLQEAKDSSAIENIVTTQDALFQSDFFAAHFQDPQAKEVYNYAYALRIGWDRIRQEKIFRLPDLLAIHAAIVENDSGLRKLPGTKLKNQQTGEVIYEPPQDAVEIERLLADFLEHFNRAEPEKLDPLVWMAVLHYQFESIHPFYDGNGRAGRILNLLFLVQHGLLDLPVLYLSRYIVRNRAGYYRGLQAVRQEGAWEPWVLYVLRGVEETARETLGKVHKIRDLMQSVKVRLRSELLHLYSQDLLNNLFRHPYTKIEFIERDLEVTRQTATKYLESLTQAGLLRKTKAGRTNYYINDPLVEILAG